VWTGSAISVKVGGVRPCWGIKLTKERPGKRQTLKEIQKSSKVYFATLMPTMCAVRKLRIGKFVGKRCLGTRDHQKKVTLLRWMCRGKKTDFPARERRLQVGNQRPEASVQ